MHSINLKDIYINCILKKLYYKFFFLNIFENPNFLNLKININNDNLFLSCYFLEMVFFIKPFIKKNKMSYNNLGKKIYNSTVLLNIFNNIYILNFFKLMFLSLKNPQLKKNVLLTIENKNINLNYILKDSIFNLYSDSLTSIFNLLQLNLKLANSNKFLNYYILRLLNLI